MTSRFARRRAIVAASAAAMIGVLPTANAENTPPAGSARAGRPGCATTNLVVGNLARVADTPGEVHRRVGQA